MTTQETTLWTGTPDLRFAKIKMWLQIIISLGILTPFAVWEYFLTKKTEVKLTTERLIVTKGIITKREDELELYRVKDTRLIQGLIGQILKVATAQLITTDKTHQYVNLQNFNAEQARELREMARTAAEQRKGKRMTMLAE